MSEPIFSRKVIQLMLKILITAGIAGLGGWTVAHNQPLRSIRDHRYTFTPREAQHLRLYPDAQYAHGLRAWTRQQPDQANMFFRQAVSQDVLFIDAWLRLAETEADMGHEDKAKSILTFTTNMTDQTVRWKWSQMVLAHELSMEQCFFRLANDLLSRKVLEQDVLQLLHTHFDGNVSAVIAALESAHLMVYFEWLVHWNMTDESLAVWRALTAICHPPKAPALRYAHFLLNQQRIAVSKEIWKTYTGNASLTNPGFEKEITGQGFDWRYWGEKEGAWNLERVNDTHAEGMYALRIRFNGDQNISFQHLSQIFTVTPNELYRLRYTWKSSGITTDQGLFVEILSYGKPGLHQAGLMLTGTCDWREESITFEAPGDCHAAMVRLRRLPSMRFDSKINGTLWIDNFRLEKTTRQQFQTTRLSNAPGSYSIPRPSP